MEYFANSMDTWQNQITCACTEKVVEELVMGYHEGFLIVFSFTLVNFQ